MTRTVQDLLVTAFGLATSVAIAVLLVLIEIRWELAIYTFTFWFIIPVGAIGAGLVAAGGYYLGARLFNHRPTSILLFNMLGISVGTFFLIHFLTYSFFEPSVITSKAAIRDHPECGHTELCRNGRIRQASPGGDLRGRRWSLRLTASECEVG